MARREPLYPHVPKGKEVQFPHTTVKAKAEAGTPITPEGLSRTELLTTRDNLETLMRTQRQKISDLEYKHLEKQLAEVNLTIARLPEVAIPKAEAGTGWVYAKVGMTEVRGRRVPTGIHIEQVSPSFNQDDFDKAVRIIEERLT